MSYNLSFFHTHCKCIDINVCAFVYSTCKHTSMCYVYMYNVQCSFFKNFLEGDGHECLPDEVPCSSHASLSATAPVGSSLCDFPYVQN